MFTFFDFFDFVGWVILRVGVPCAIIFALWVFQRRISAQRYRWVVEFFSCLLFCAAFLGVLWQLVMPVMFAWPPHWLERVHQRQEVYERARTAGGWDLIKKEANDLVRTNAADGFTWRAHAKPGDNPPLPKSLQALKPKRVDFWFEQDGAYSVRIDIFGAHATGGRGEDFYSIKVVCPYPTNVQTLILVEPEGKVRYGDRKIVEDIYEVTRRD